MAENEIKQILCEFTKRMTLQSWNFHRTPSAASDLSSRRGKHRQRIRRRAETHPEAVANDFPKNSHVIFMDAVKIAKDEGLEP